MYIYRAVVLNYMVGRKTGLFLVDREWKSSQVHALQSNSA